jgi:DNA-binding CsgD family transcriptional regulator
VADGGFISERDLRRLSDCILRLHATPLDSPGFVARVVGLFGHLVEAESAFYGITEIPAKRTLVGLAVPQDLVTPEHAASFDRHFDDHPLHFPEATRKPVFRLSERLSMTTWRRTGLFNEFFAPAGIEHQVLMRLPSAPRYAHALGAGRLYRDFSSKHRILCEAFYEHVRLAFAKSGRLPIRGGSAERVPRVRRLEVDDRGRILSSSRQGDDLLVTCLYRSRADAPLNTIPGTLRDWIRRGVADAASIRIDPQYGILRITSGGRAFECHLVPNREGGRHLVNYFELDSANRGSVARLPDEARRERALVEAASAWNLTSRQTKVLRLLLLGQSNKEIAAELNRTEAAVEFHVTSLLRRSGASRRGELVARLLGSDAPARLR